jgi:hypothetical protein
VRDSSNGRLYVSSDRVKFKLRKKAFLSTEPKMTWRQGNPPGYARYSPKRVHLELEKLDYSVGEKCKFNFRVGLYGAWIAETNGDLPNDFGNSSET